MNWERINVWTSTLYTLIHAVGAAKNRRFGNLNKLHDYAISTKSWIAPECSYSSILLHHRGGADRITFRRDPNKYFDSIAHQMVKMLLQDLVVIFDQMMTESLEDHRESAGIFPQSKIEKLATHLDARYLWSAHGCFELVAVRNVLTHNDGVWNDASIRIIRDFVTPLPMDGEKLSVGFSMLFRYRKAIRTFLNETAA